MGKVLLVDDEPEFLEVLKATLDEAGFDTLIASSGIDALAMVKQNHEIDCILADYFMPEMRGDELALSIRHKSRIPVLIMSGDPNLPFDKLHGCGISGVLTKPVESQNFIDFLKANDIHLAPDVNSYNRKFLRRSLNQLPLEAFVSNGSKHTTGKLLNMSTGGFAACLKEAIEPISTITFTLTKDEESVKGFAHCRWKNTSSDGLKAGFEFDSITKKDLSQNERFQKWISVS